MIKRLGIFGSNGRMGQAIVSEVANYPEKINQLLLYKRDENLTDFLQSCDIVIDVSSNSGTEMLVNSLPKSNFPKLVICTTGLSEYTLETLKVVSLETSVLQSYNMSKAVNLISKICSIITDAIGNEVDIDIIESHHKHKLDSPSGTALMLANSIEKSHPNRNNLITSFSNSSARKPNELRITSIRSGEIIGDHQIDFINGNEKISIKHSAFSRNLFAKGAIDAAIWLNLKGKGYYSMLDIIN